MQRERGSRRVLWRLFAEFFKIALLVVGGGHAILVVADDVFGRKLKWLREGELIEHLPVFQMVPGLIAGNSAIYVGLKTAGRLGALVALVAVALPSFLIILAVAYGYNALPLDNRWIASAFFGLRSSLTGILLGVIVKGWRKNIVGPYGYIALAVAAALLLFCGVGTVSVLALAILAGIALEFAGLGGAPDTLSAGVEVAAGNRWRTVVLAVAFLAAMTLLNGCIFWLFVKFGLLCFGGGFVLVPVYVQEFVGEAAPLLQISAEEFSNLMAITQMTPGPVSVNAATFFGFRLAGVLGSAIATAGLLTPSYFLLTAALTGLERWKSSRIVKGLVRGVKPATIALMIAAMRTFLVMSIVTRTENGFAFSPFALLLALFSAYMVVKGRLSVMATIFACAAAGMLGRLALGR